MYKPFVYSVDLSDHRYDVKIDPKQQYGYFEHPIWEDRCGGLWFEGKTLIDYDGVGILPAAVCELLTFGGYYVSHEFWPRDTWRTGKPTVELAEPGIAYRSRENGAFCACIQRDPDGDIPFTVNAFTEIDAGYCLDAVSFIEAGPMRHYAPDDGTHSAQSFTAPEIIWIR